MVGTVATINSIKGILDKNKTDMANSLVYLYQDWRIQRDQWIEEKKELRNYLFATDTTSTSNNELHWMNKTTMPKLTQIEDNLHANYMDALFPNDDWLIWEGDDVDSFSKEKRKILELYAKNKAKASGLEDTVSKLLYDYIDTGNAFGEVIWINETHLDPVTKEEVTTYMGPKLVQSMACEGAAVDHAPALARLLAGKRPKDRPLVVRAHIDPAQYTQQF